jgi:hypothetical protein
MRRKTRRRKRRKKRESTALGRLWTRTSQQTMVRRFVYTGNGALPIS